jgi:anti-sigma factor RsiW
MEHEQVQVLLSDYHEGILLPQQRQAIEQHLHVCPACQKDLAMIQKAIEIAKRVPQVKAPSDFVGRVRQRAHKLGYIKGRRHARQNRFFVMWEATLLVLLATIGALVVLMLFWQQLPVQMRPVVRPEQVLDLSNQRNLQAAAVATWAVGGKVYVNGKIAVPGSPMPTENAVDLFVPKERWNEYLELVVKNDLGSTIPSKPEANADDMIHIVATAKSNN